MVSWLCWVRKMDKGIGLKSRTVTAAVSVGVFAQLTKVSHWETGKAEQIRRSFRKTPKGTSQKTYKDGFFARTKTAVASFAIAVYLFLQMHL